MTTNTLAFFHLLYNLVLHSAPLKLKTLIPPHHPYFGLKPVHTNSGMPKTALAEDRETRAGWYFFEPEKELWSNYWETCKDCTLISLNSGCLSVSFRNRTAERRGQQNAWVWQTWRGHYLPVFSRIHLTLMFFFFDKKICLTECEVWGKVFPNTIIVTLATQGLPSTFSSCYVSSLLTD